MQSHKTPDIIEINIDEIKNISSEIKPIELAERLDDILDDISKITGKYNDSIKSNSNDELLNIILSDLESHIKQINNNKTHATNNTSKTIINQIIQTLTNAISTNKKNDSKDSKHTPFDQSTLFQNQQLLEKHEISTKFVAALEKIKALAKFECVSVYISHGEGNHNGEQDEGTLPGIIHFLQTLRDHLNQAGIYAKISIDSGDFGFGGIYRFQEKASSSNYFLIAGTENYLRKHNSKTDMVVCGDLVMIHRKRELSEKLGRPKCVFPITISGSLQSSLPEYFHNYTSEQDWTVSGTYFTHLKRLISVFLNFKNPKKNESLQKIWGDFLSQLDSETAIRLDPKYLNNHSALSTDQLPQTSTATKTPPSDLNTATSTSGSSKDVKSTPSKVTDSKTATAYASSSMKGPVEIEPASEQPPAYKDVDDNATPPLYSQTSPLNAQAITELSVLNHSMLKELIDAKKHDELIRNITRPLEEKIKALDAKDVRKIVCLEALNTLNKSDQNQLQLQALVNAHNLLYKNESKTSTLFTKSDCIYKLIRHWFYKNQGYLNNMYGMKLTNHTLELPDKSSYTNSNALR